MTRLETRKIELIVICGIFDQSQKSVGDEQKIIAYLATYICGSIHVGMLVYK